MKIKKFNKMYKKIVGCLLEKEGFNPCVYIINEANEGLFFCDQATTKLFLKLLKEDFATFEALRQKYSI